MANLVFIHASDGSNAALAGEVEVHARAMGHSVEHVSLNAYDFPSHRGGEKATPFLMASAI